MLFILSGRISSSLITAFIFFCKHMLSLIGYSSCNHHLLSFCLNTLQNLGLDTVGVKMTKNGAIEVTAFLPSSLFFFSEFALTI